MTSTTNSKADVELMVAWLNGCVVRARIDESERNIAIQKEIEDCIRSTLIKKK